jgi:hypothetical protein
LSPARPPDWLWNRARLGAAAAFVLCAFLLGFRSPGLSHDEAAGLTGAVRMLTPGQASFPHDPASGFTFAGRWWPLMATPDRGPLRGYLSLLPFAAYGANYSTVRLLAALLGAFGIWGFSILTRDLRSPCTRVAWASGWSRSACCRLPWRNT